MLWFMGGPTFDRATTGPFFPFVRVAADILEYSYK